MKKQYQIDKQRAVQQLRRLATEENPNIQMVRYSNPDNDKKGPWRSIPFSAQGFRTNQMYKIETPTKHLLDPPKGRCCGATELEYLRLRDVEKRVYFPKGGNLRLTSAFRDACRSVDRFRSEERGSEPDPPSAIGPE